MVGLGILLAHLVGDYIFQDDAMALKKTTSWRWAIYHALTYSLPYILLFVLLQAPLWPAVAAWAIIAGTHAVIDRYRLAKHVIWGRNQLVPRSFRYPWSEAKDNAGYSAGKPVWMSTWLMIIVDNSIHLVINTVAILIFLV